MASNIPRRPEPMKKTARTGAVTGFVESKSIY